MKNPTKIVALSLVASLACMTAPLANAQTWTGGDLPINNLNWSDANNWSGGAPGSSSTVIFNDGAFPLTTNTQGAVNNIVQSSTTISSLTYNNQDNNFVTTLIPSGATLTISGNLSVGASDIATSNSFVTMTGGGTLIGGTGGSSTLSGQNGSAQGSVSTLDLSGLTNFSYNFGGGSSGSINLGTGSSGSSITFNLAAVSNNITAGTLNVGNNNTRGTCIMNLGNGTNIINADTINLGISKTAGTMQFINNAGGGVKIASHTGTGRAALTLGGEASSGSTSTVNTGNMFFLGGTVNILASSITIPSRGGRASGSALGNLYFNSGLVDATFINMSTNASGGTAANGTVAVGGSGVLKVVNFSMVNNGGAAGAGNLIITNGGSVICSNNIFKATSTGVATIWMNSGSLTMASIGGTIGNVSGSPIAIDNFDTTNSVLTVPALGVGNPEILVTTFNPDTATPTTINIGSLPVISSYPQQFPIISYTTAGNSLGGIALGTLPAFFQGYLSNNVNNLSIDIVITNGPSFKSDTWTGAANNLWDTTSRDWLSSGIATNYSELDMVTFDDTAHTGSVNIVAAHTPASVNGLTFLNNSTNYVFTGVGKITGPVEMSMQGSASVTLAEAGGDNFSGGIFMSQGTLILDDTNCAISGGLTINGGSAVVQIGNNDANGNLPGGTLSDQGTLIFDRSNNFTVSVSIPGGGNVSQDGSGTLTLSAANTYSGNTTVTNGILALTGSGTIASSSQVSVYGATLDISGESNSTTNNTLTLSNATLNVKVGYLQTNLTVNTLNLLGTANTINVKTLPAIVHYPATNGLVVSANTISGSSYVLGTLLAATPAYAGSIVLGPGGNSLLLVLTSGPTNARPSVTWSGSDGQTIGVTNWSDPFNWITPGTPTATEPVTFNDNDTAGGSPFSNIGDGVAGITSQANIENFANINQTNASLTYANSTGYHNTEIASGKTLAINGSVTVSGSSGIVSILGAGAAFRVTNPNNTTTFSVEAATTAPTLDMSGLDTFSGGIDQIAIGYDAASQGTVVYGVWYLAKTNFITTASGSLGLGAAWVIGGSDNQNSTGNGQVYLGQTNSIYVDGIALGVAGSVGDVLTFNPYVTNNNPVAYIRGITGDSSRVTMWSLGDDTINLNNNASGSGQIVDFTGGTLNALVNTLVVGQGSQGNEANSLLVGTFNMGAGNLDVTTLNIGEADNGKTGGAGSGVVNVTGGTLEANTLNLGLGNVTGTAGTLNLTNATLMASNGITVASTEGADIVSESASTVKFFGGTIGTAGVPLNTLNVTAGTLQFSLNGSLGSAVVTATTVNASGAPTVLKITSLSNVAAEVTYPLVSYTGTDPFANFSLSLPAGYTGTLLDDAGSVDLQLTSIPATQPHITGIGINGKTLTITATNGADSGTFTLLESTNVTLPLSQWTPVFTNSFDGSGDLNLSTNIVTPGIRSEFYILVQP